MSIECSKAFAVVGSPNDREIIFGCGENEITLSVEANLGDGTRVTMKQKRSL